MAAELFLILSGEVEASQQNNGGHREWLGRLGAGEFFGELGIARRRPRSRDVVAASSLTCLVLSPAPPAKFAGRGRGARLASALPGAQASASPAAGNVRAGQDVICCDVSEQVMRKVEALSAYRSQFPLEPDMFPGFLLQEMFGCEYFVAARPAHLEQVPAGPVLEPHLSTPLPADGQAGGLATRGKRTPSAMTRRRARRHATRHP